MNAGRTQRKRPKVTVQSEATIMVFDDGSSFEYLSDLEIPGVVIHKCRTFEEVEHYLTGVRLGNFRPPIILGVDVYCEAHPDFAMFDVDVDLDPRICGYQLYEHVIRCAGEAFQQADVLFFTSFSGRIGDISTQRLKEKFSVRIENCARFEFRDKLLSFAVDRGLIDTNVAQNLQRVGLTQDEYWALFSVIAREFGFSDSEKCAFFGVLSGRLVDTETLVRTSTVGNERIDEVLAISVLLDRILSMGDKRGYLEVLEPLGDGRRAFDLLLAGSVKDLIGIRNDLEFRLGGAIL